MTTQSEEVSQTHPLGPVVESAKTRKTFAMVLMICLLVLSVLSLLLGITNIFLYIDYGNSYAMTENTHVEFTIIIVETIFDFMWNILNIVFIVAFLMWLHRAYKRLQYFGVKGLSYSPAWAVGWYFIPILAAIIPYIVMRELWNASFYAEQDSAQWRKKPAAWLLFWWLPYLAASFINRLNNRLSFETAGDYKLDAIYVLIVESSYILSGVMLLMMMNRVTKAQDEELGERMTAPDEEEVMI